MDTIIVVAGVVFDKERVLVSQRRAGTHLAGLWEFPGGKVEKAEDPRDALRRELREELGVLVRVGEIFEVGYHRDDSRSILILFFEAHLEPESPPPSALEVAAWRWAGASELDPSAFPPADVSVLAKVRTRLASAVL